MEPRGLALGFLAMLPLVCAYELAIDRVGLRNSAEMLLSLPLRAVGTHESLARCVVLALCAAWAGWRAFDARLGLAAHLWRIVLEGALGAVVIGPALVALFAVLGAGPAPAELALVAEVPASGARAALIAGGAAYEELVFRVGLQTVLVGCLRSVLQAFSRSSGSLLSGPGMRAVTELLALSLASLAFAAAHLAVVTAPLGLGGESFDGPVFTWRFLAGMLLGGLFRWRGPGVAAWTHALFNWALLIGAGPSVFL